MSTQIKENLKRLDYAKNLKRFLNVEDFDLKILKKSFGILKGTLKKTPLKIQKEMRKEWERKKIDSKFFVYN